MKRIVLAASCCAFVLAFALFSSLTISSAKMKEIEIKGYITELHSSTSFEIDEYRISIEGKNVIELENVDEKSVKFDSLQHLRIGTLIKLKGKIDTETKALTVKEIKIDLKQFRRFSKTTVLDTKPEDVTKLENGRWAGTVHADGRRIIIDANTIVSFRLNKSEEKEAKQTKEEKDQLEEKVIPTVVAPAAPNAADPEKGVNESNEKLSNKSKDDSFGDDDEMSDLLIGAKPLQSLEQIGPGVYMTYKGVEDLNGSVRASDVVFIKNEKTKQEKNIWKSLRLKEKDAKNANSFGTLKVGGTKYKALPETEVQDYVERLGLSLIPEYQKALPEDDENKVPFNFTVVYEKGFNASAYPTGTVIIHHDVFNYLENEAQLAFLISHEIAHATQEHSIRAANKDKGKRTGLFIGKVFASAMGYGLLANALTLTEAAMVNGYARNQENQADRIGMSNMLARGYDPRQAPRTWKVVAMDDGDNPSNFFWSSHASKSERRSFLMITIRNTYPTVDFAKLKLDSEEFQRVAGVIKDKYPDKKKKKKSLQL